MLFLKDIKLDTLADLKSALQTAIMLEHSTIPPYLTAVFTLVNTGNDQISSLIGSVVKEEMLHLSIACNILNAINGTPVLNQPGFIPTYPGPLPGTVESGLIVPIAKFSKDLIKNVFMVIEEPENPMHIPVKAMNEMAAPLTIGMFYQKVKNLITILEAEAKLLGKTIFTGDPAKQMTNEKWFPLEELFPILDKDSAFRGIDLIVDQGEGTSEDPFINPGDLGGDDVTTDPAHYYRFEEIFYGKTLEKDPSEPCGYSYSGPEIPCDLSKIPNMYENPKMADYPLDSVAYKNSKFFNYTYTNLLNSLHETFNGEPDKINTAMGLMYSLRLYAGKLLASEDPAHPGFVAGPSYEYVTNDNLSPDERQLLAADRKVHA
ncbi:ferritin-like domain-containing protein [Pedobacter polysacchareus]|uniref:ferritin-like domain-containing protein n=1 Tax=Pedobacter polysacchareus TaxID=2861973 RepID=UPI001C993BF5|nr:ferritin-like protein [Pedobacter polysacchareus]